LLAAFSVFDWQRNKRDEFELPFRQFTSNFHVQERLCLVRRTKSIARGRQTTNSPAKTIAALEQRHNSSSPTHVGANDD
jgi:hypothetical protein